MAKIWQLSANYSGLTATGTINGFPVFSADTDGSEAGFATAPLNPFLIGKGNVLRVEVTKKAENAKLSCSVEDAMTGDVIDTGNATEIPLPEGDPPHVIEIKFDSELDGFKQLLAQARPSDAKTITDFALKIRDILNAGDKDAAMALFKPKFDAIAENFGQPLEMIMGQAGEMIAFFTSVKHEFTADDVNAVPCCDNKLWELKDKEDKPLVRIKQDDGSSMLDLCVAVLPDGPAIVR